MTEIKHIRLTNGEELISEVHHTDTENFYLANPLYPIEGEMGETILMRYAPYSESSLVPIQKKHVLMCTDIHKEMRRHYHLSLKATAEYEKAAIDALRQVNNDMEQSLVAPRRRRTRIVAPGSNLKH